MALYPNKNVDDRDTLSMIEDFYQRAISENQSYWYEASIDARFEAGDNSVWQEIYQIPAKYRNLFGFNKIRRIINMIDGHQRQTRKSIASAPIENADELTSDQLSKIIIWILNRESALDTISDAFQSACISGMSLIEVWSDFSQDPISGFFKIDYCPYSSFVIDPYFKKTDLSDCNGLFRRSYLTPAQCAALLPDRASEIIDLRPNGTASDGKFPYMPQNSSIAASKTLTYDEFYYRTYRIKKIITNTETGRIVEWKNDDDTKLREYMSSFPMLTLTETMVPTIQLAIVVQNKLMYCGKNGLNIDSMPFIPVFAYFRPDLQTMPNRIQSVVRGLRDAQYLYNRRRMTELDALDSVTNTGLIYKEGTLIDPDQVHGTGNGRSIGIKSTANMADIQQIPPLNIPDSWFRMSESLGNELPEIAGASEILLGADDNSRSGIESMLRQRASLTTLQGLFDGVTRTKKILGDLLISAIQANFTPGKVERILNEEPSPEFYNRSFGKYDCVVVSSVDTDSQRALALSQMLELKKAGVMIPDEAIMENVTIQNKQDVIKAMQQQAQAAQQMQQQQAQVQMEEMQMRSELARARESEQYALAQERTTRSALNAASIQERHSEADKDNTQAKLNYIKALSELENMDIAKLEKLVAIAQMLEAPKQEATQNITP